MSWQTQETRIVYENQWISVREDAVVGPSGEGIYGVVTLRHPAVFIIALDAHDRICLVNLDRYTTGPSIEVPAGGSDGEKPKLAAQREFYEETGLQAAQWTLLGQMNALNGVTVAPEYVFLARGINNLDTPARPQTDEGIREVNWVPFAEVLGMIADGRITDGETIAALTYAGIHLGRFR